MLVGEANVQLGGRAPRPQLHRQGLLPFIPPSWVHTASVDRLYT